MVWTCIEFLNTKHFLFPTKTVKFVNVYVHDILRVENTLIPYIKVLGTLSLKNLCATEQKVKNCPWKFKKSVGIWIEL